MSAGMLPMRLGARLLTLAVATTAVLAGYPRDSAVAQDAPSDAISYVERQLRDRAGEVRRDPLEAGDAYYGIDINSVVEIGIDSEKLYDALVPLASGSALTPDQQALLDTLRHLGEATELIAPTMQRYALLVATYETAIATGDMAEFRQQRNEARSQMLTLLRTLTAATEARLIREGIDATTANRLARRSLDPILGLAGNEDRLVLGYDWPEFDRLYSEELEYVELALREVADEVGLNIQVSGHLVSGSAASVPIFLPKYNEVPTGVATVFPKIRFEIPEAQVALRDEYAGIASNLGEADSVTEALKAGLRADLDRNRDRLQEEVQAVQSAIDALQMNVENLERWKDETNREQWIADFQTSLEQSTAGMEFLMAWQATETMIEEVESDFETLKDLRASINQIATPEAALRTVLGGLRTIGFDDNAPGDFFGLTVLDPDVWQQRAATVRMLIDAVADVADTVPAALAADDDSPIADLRDTAQAIQDVVPAFTDLVDAVKVALNGVSVSAPIAGADALPEAQGQRALGLSSDSNLDTSFNLRTILEGRQPDQEVLIGYTFSEGETELDTMWSDRFRVRLFGWQDHVTASLAFARQEGANKWKPTASLSWLLSRRRWPKPGESGLHQLQGLRWFSGFGFSAMPLDFDPDESSEIGVAFSLSFLNDRIIVGYGSNLQAATNEEFSFISVRLFQADGVITRNTR